MQISRIIILIFIGFYFAGCSKKTTPTGPVPIYTKDQALKALQDHNIDFTWWVGKGKVNIDSPQESGGGKAYLRIQKDSIIWMAAKKIGIEGMRMKVQPDSFWIKYPLDKVYQRGLVGDFLSMYELGVDFIDLQQLMAGNIMLPDSATSVFEQVGSRIQLKYRDPSFDYIYTFEPYEFNLAQVDIVDYLGREIKIQYDDYKEAKNNERQLSHKRILTIEETTKMAFKFSEILIDVPKKTEFSISSRYREIGL